MKITFLIGVNFIEIDNIVMLLQYIAKRFKFKVIKVIILILGYNNYNLLNIDDIIMM